MPIRSYLMPMAIWMPDNNGFVCVFSSPTLLQQKYGPTILINLMIWRHSIKRTKSLLGTWLFFVSHSLSLSLSPSLRVCILKSNYQWYSRYERIKSEEQFVKVKHHRGRFYENFLETDSLPYIYLVRLTWSRELPPTSNNNDDEREKKTEQPK